MSGRLWLIRGAILTAFLAPRPAGGQDAHPGKADYDKWCAGCHGVDGKGDGFAANYMLPRPRDFTAALYQIRTTPSGALPTDQDIRRVIDDGMPGTAMPGWKDHLGEDARDALVAYLKTFAPRFESQDAPESIEIGSAPGESEEALALGRQLYEKIECAKCHGEAGRGGGPSAPTLEDDQDLPVRAADLTESWNFNGGATTEAVFTRLMTGLNGTPMPSFADLIDAEVVTEEELWRIAQYVQSLSPPAPQSREVIRAGRAEGALPSKIDDPAWDAVARSYVPLVGQVIVAPRWFEPSVDGVWVQALHDGEEIAILLSWHDPSESPDPEWDEWEAKVRAAMFPDSVSAAAASADSAAPGDSASAAPPPAGPVGGLHDALVVQFPTTIPEGMERPYFLMGSEEEPVYLWRWESGAGGVREALGSGFAVIEPLAGEGVTTAQAVYDQGEWRLLVRRALQAEELEGRLQFEAGRAIPMALFAWDGSNAESGTQGSLSTWYFLYLDQPAASTVYVFPIAAMLLTAALGAVVVVRAQRRSGRHAHEPDSD